MRDFSSGIQYVVKRPSETRRYSLDFSNLLQTIVSLNSVSVDSLNLTVANSTFSGTVVQLDISDGIDGENYFVTVSVTDFLNNIITETIIVKCRATVDTPLLPTSVTGLASGAVTSVVIYQGPKGDKGDQGPPGTGISGGSIVLDQAAFDSFLYTVASLSPQVLHSFPYTQFGAGKYIIYGAFGVNRQICELLLLQDGTTVVITEYANMVTSILLGTFTADITGGFVRLMVTPTQIGTTFRVVRTLIND